MTPSSEDHKAVELESADAQPHAVDSFAENLQLFWFKYRTIILWCAGLILVGIVGKGAYDMYVESREKATGAEYAAAGDSSEKLRQFAASHEGHTLAGLATLRVADELYSTGKYAEAQVQYDKAVVSMNDFPAKGRARLGSALSLVLSGKGAEGEAALKVLIADANEFKGLRAEASYHLAMLNAEAGKNEEAVKIIDQLVQIDMVSGWARRAMMMRSSLAATLPPVAAPEKAAEPALKLSVPGAGK